MKEDILTAAILVLAVCFIGTRSADRSAALEERNLCVAEKALLEETYRKRVDLVEYCEDLGAFNSARAGWFIVYWHCPSDPTEGEEVALID